MDTIRDSKFDAGSSRDCEELSSEETSDNNKDIDLCESDCDCALSKRLHLSVKAQQIILNVYYNMLKTENKARAIEKTAFLTNIPDRTIYTLIKKGVQKRKTRANKGQQKQIDPLVAKIIEESICNSQQTGQCPTRESMLQEIILKIPNFRHCGGTVGNWVKKIGFKYAILPSRFSSREKIEDFLVKHDLYYEDHYTKKELLEVLATKEFTRRQYIQDDDTVETN